MKNQKKNYPSTRRKRRNKKRAPLFFAIGGIVLLAAALFSLGRSNALEKAPIEVKGAPSLKVDQETLDFGYVSYEQPVYATFTLTNVGDKTLRFTQKPYIEVLEGC